MDDVFIRLQTKQEIFKVIEKNHRILLSKTMKAASVKSSIFLTRVKFLGHIIEDKTITPLKSRKDAILKLQPQSNKKKIQDFLGMIKCLTKHLHGMHLYLKPVHNILRQQNIFEWMLEHQKKIVEIKILLTEQISNTIPDPNQQFYAICDSSNFYNSLQSHKGRNIMNILPPNSRVFLHANLDYLHLWENVQL